MTRIVDEQQPGHSAKVRRHGPRELGSQVRVARLFTVPLDVEPMDSTPIEGPSAPSSATVEAIRLESTA